MQIDNKKQSRIRRKFHIFFRKQKKNKGVNRIILIVLLLGAGAVAYYKYQESLKYETTDDAQLDTDMTSVASRITGYIDKVNFVDNQLVKKGDTLIVFDNRELKIRVEQAQAALENARASIKTTKATANSVKDNGGTNIYKIEELKVRLANAQKEYERYKKLLVLGSVTQQQFDKVQTDKEALEKQIQSALQTQKESSSKTGAANEQISVAETVVKQRQSDLDYAKLQLSYSVIIAPFDGVVSKKNAVGGQLIQASQSVCSIVASENLWITANFKETQMTNMKEGQKVEISVDAFPNRKITGKVGSFASSTGSRFSLIPPDNASGNYVKVVQRVPVKIELDKNAAMLKGLKAGMSVFVKIQII